MTSLYNFQRRRARPWTEFFFHLPLIYCISFFFLSLFSFFSSYEISCFPVIHLTWEKLNVCNCGNFISTCHDVRALNSPIFRAYRAYWRVLLIDNYWCNLNWICIWDYQSKCMCVQEDNVGWTMDVGLEREEVLRVHCDWLYWKFITFLIILNLWNPEKIHILWPQWPFAKI